MNGSVQPAEPAPEVAGAETKVRLGSGLRYGHTVVSMCPRCLKTIPGTVSSTAAGVVMRKTCSEHGAFESLIATDIGSYERMRRSPRIVQRPLRVHSPEKHGCPDDCGLCPVHDQHTCLAIVEITQRCNLPCPVCLVSATAKGPELSSEQVFAALQSLLETEGQPVPLQIAGGEPTLHSELAGIIRGARALGFKKIEVDSNGLLLARDPALARELHAAGLTGVYLQMDGLRAPESAFIRGRDLRAEKMQAIAHCRSAGLQVVLAVTVVPGVNDQELWALIRFAIEQRLTGINFQPVVLSGRYPAELEQGHRRFTATHFLRAMEKQSEGQLRASDLMPMSCPDPRCGLLAYIVVGKDGRLLPLRRLLGDERLRQHVADMSDWEVLLRQLGCSSTGCGCGGEAEEDQRRRLAEVLEGAELFSVGFHGMMDALCFDQERARRCCVHKLMPDGRLMPFCLYNMKYRQLEGGSGEHAVRP